MLDTILTPARKRALALSLVAALLLYVGAAGVTGWPAMKAALGGMGWGVVAAALGLSLVNYLLRFVRWQLYLARLGHHVPAAPSLTIYLAGFALTTSPGKAGEMVRGLFLKRRGVPLPDTLAAFLAERVSDLVAVVALCALGLLAGPWRLAGIIAIAAASGVLAMLAFPALTTPLRRLLPAGGRTGALADRAFALLGQVHACFAPAPLLAAFLLGLIAWGAEGVALYLMLGAMGEAVALDQSVFIYGASLIIGALSMIPAGLGSAELTMASLLGAAGVGAAAAGAVTLAIRLVTLWFAVALGAVALALAARDRPQAAAATPPAI